MAKGANSGNKRPLPDLQSSLLAQEDCNVCPDPMQQNFLIKIFKTLITERLTMKQKYSISYIPSHLWSYQISSPSNQQIKTKREPLGSTVP